MKSPTPSATVTDDPPPCSRCDRSDHLWRGNGADLCRACEPLSMAELERGEVWNGDGWVMLSPEAASGCRCALCLAIKAHYGLEPGWVCGDAARRARFEFGEVGAR